MSRKNPQYIYQVHEDQEPAGEFYIDRRELRDELRDLGEHMTDLLANCEVVKYEIVEVARQPALDEVAGIKMRQRRAASTRSGAALRGQTPEQVPARDTGCTHRVNLANDMQNMLQTTAMFTLQGRPLNTATEVVEALCADKRVAIRNPNTGVVEYLVPPSGFEVVYDHSTRSVNDGSVVREKAPRPRQGGRRRPAEAPAPKPKPKPRDTKPGTGASVQRGRGRGRGV